MTDSLDEVINEHMKRVYREKLDLVQDHNWCRASQQSHEAGWEVAAAILTLAHYSALQYTESTQKISSESSP